MDGRPWRAAPGGVRLTVKVTPRGGRDALDGAETVADGRAVLKLRVKSPPHDGAANEAVRRLVATLAGRPPSAVRLEAGGASRVKTLAVDGDAAEIEAALALASGLGPGS
jgi:uncharacterized protein